METEFENSAKYNQSTPTRHFSFPHEVIDDPSLSASEKRDLLCEWASDACAVPSFPTLRLLPGTSFPVTFSAVMDALAQLDRRKEAQESMACSRGWGGVRLPGIVAGDGGGP